MCNEGMLRKLGPTVSLTTFFVSVWDLLSLALCVEIPADMHKQTIRFFNHEVIGISISKVVSLSFRSLIVHPCASTRRLTMASP